jgi:hypothetical protein
MNKIVLRIISMIVAIATILGNHIQTPAALVMNRRPAIDFDGDGKSELAVWKQSTATWNIKYADGTNSSQQWGSVQAGDIPMPADYDGDGKTDYAVWRQSTGNWYVIYSSDGSTSTRQWGNAAAADIPVNGDFNGDGKADLSVWRKSTGIWYVKYADDTTSSMQWGNASVGDIPVSGDFDGDGRTDYAVWRPPNGTWYIKYASSGATASQQWGSGNLRDFPMPGDYDGDGKSDLAVWRPANGTWYIKYMGNGATASQQWGNSIVGDLPISGDFDGDGRLDYAVWRQSTNYWYIKYSADGSTFSDQWGNAASNDISLPPTISLLPQGSMWISKNELMSLPTSGTPWDKMRTIAYGSWGTPDLKDKDNKNALYTLAGALVYARTGDNTLRSKVRNAIILAKRSLDESAEWQTDSGVLAAGRQIGTYVISADLINLKVYDVTTDTEFRNWLTWIRATNIGTHSRWKSITYTCENSTGNWNTFACASRIAASIYVGDTADVNRSVSIIRAYFGERNLYPADAPGANGYFDHTAAYQPSWACNDSIWTGSNPTCVKYGINIDGALVEDASRGGSCCIPQGDGISYQWEALQGLFVSTELLYRTGNYGNPYNWSNQALRRSVDFMWRSGWGISTAAMYVAWMTNVRYSTWYPAGPSISGRIMGWGDWLYQR